MEKYQTKISPQRLLYGPHNKRESDQLLHIPIRIIFSEKVLMIMNPDDRPFC